MNLPFFTSCPFLLFFGARSLDAWSKIIHPPCSILLFLERGAWKLGARSFTILHPCSFLLFFWSVERGSVERDYSYFIPASFSLFLPPCSIILPFFLERGSWKRGARSFIHPPSLFLPPFSKFHSSRSILLLFWSVELGSVEQDHSSSFLHSPCSFLPVPFSFPPIPSSNPTYSDRNDFTGFIVAALIA